MTGSVPIWMCIPFAGMLLSIALGPVLAPNFWEKHEPHVVAFFVVFASILMCVGFGPAGMGEKILDCIINDYLTFIVLLFGLYCVSGNISFDGDLAGSPRVNVTLLLIGTILSSMIGTTGSSMLMVRPVIKMNRWRTHRAHIMIFFIFLVSNIGGCLTPVGDPPLLMGFMRGVPFFWSLHLLPVLLVNLAVLLTVFYLVDLHEYRKDVAEGARPNLSQEGMQLKLSGVHNLIFLIMIVGAVILSGVLPGLQAFQDSQGNTKGLPLPFGVELGWPDLIEIAIILLAAFLSFKTTSSNVRRRNHFTWGAIQEVAVLFIGIFITMQPALMLLKAKGGELGLDHAYQMFWATGALSSFLDNTPTYLVFLTTAGAIGFTKGMTTAVGVVPVEMLAAISAGAVFMGSVTYIGNAPNFMVKSISDENGVVMPSFFGYMKWSLAFLMPVFALDTLLFFM